MSFIYVPFSYLLKGCLYVSGNHYILALLFFALVMQIILLPLAIKQHKSQIMMAKVKPKEMAIREKYKGRTDRVTQQKMTIEIQNMYQESGYNQFSGCLPLLIQLPIILILFNIVRQPISYASNLLDNNLNFMSENSAYAVEYYQTEKEALLKEGFDSETAYNEYVNIINGYQVNLGGKENKELSEEKGIAVYEFDSINTNTAEFQLSQLIIDGESTVEELVSDGKLPEGFMEVYKSEGYNFTEKYSKELPNYRVYGVNLLDEPSLKGDYWLLIVPILVFLTSFLSTKLTRKMSGAAQQTDASGNPIGGGMFMEVGMPLISTIFAFSFSAAIGAYWIWRTVVSMLQTFLLHKFMPIPAVTEEDIAAARKEMKSKQKKKKVITIEVDEDDTSYDDMIVTKTTKENGEKVRYVDPATRTPRRIEMLTADDEEENGSSEE